MLTNIILLYGQAVPDIGYGSHINVLCLWVAESNNPSPCSEVSSITVDKTERLQMHDVAVSIDLRTS